MSTHPEASILSPQVVRDLLPGARAMAAELPASQRCDDPDCSLPLFEGVCPLCMALNERGGDAWHELAFLQLTGGLPGHPPTEPRHERTLSEIVAERLGPPEDIGQWFTRTTLQRIEGLKRLPLHRILEVLQALDDLERRWAEQERGQ